MAASCRGRALPAALAPVGMQVVAVQCDRGRVVVQLRAVDTELLDRFKRQLCQQRRTVTVKQLIERSADAVIAQQRHLVGL